MCTFCFITFQILFRFVKCNSDSRECRSNTEKRTNSIDRIIQCGKNESLLDLFRMFMTSITLPRSLLSVSILCRRRVSIIAKFAVVINVQSCECVAHHMRKSNLMTWLTDCNSIWNIFYLPS